MNIRKSERLPRLFSAALALFLVQALFFTFAVNSSFAAPSTDPDHVLTYTTGKLTWDSATGIDANGSAVLDLFDNAYNNAQAANGDNIIAPGTGKDATVRLKNDASGSVTYTAVLYQIPEDFEVDLHYGLTGTHTDTATYPLPDGVTAKQVLRAVTGTVNAGAYQDFNVAWFWNFEEGDAQDQIAAQDQIDTALGNRASNGEDIRVKCGIYIVVEDNNNNNNGGNGGGVIKPSAPQTGDTANIAQYAVVMLISGVAAAFLLVIFFRRNKKQCAE